MSKKANPTLIGAFVLIALTVAVAAIMVLGKFNFKDNTVRCVAYFSGSMHGLDVGALSAQKPVILDESDVEVDEQLHRIAAEMGFDEELSAALRHHAR